MKDWKKKGTDAQEILLMVVRINNGDVQKVDNNIRNVIKTLKEENIPVEKFRVIAEGLENDKLNRFVEDLAYNYLSSMEKGDEEKIKTAKKDYQDAIYLKQEYFGIEDLSKDLANKGFKFNPNIDRNKTVKTNKNIDI